MFGGSDEVNPPVTAQTQIFEEKANLDPHTVPIHHVGAGVALVIGFLAAIVVLNHKANS